MVIGAFFCKKNKHLCKKYFLDEQYYVQQKENTLKKITKIDEIKPSHKKSELIRALIEADKK